MYTLYSVWTCDVCGSEEHLEDPDLSDLGVAPLGWTIEDDYDLCPACEIGRYEDEDDAEEDDTEEV